MLRLRPPPKEWLEFASKCPKGVIAGGCLRDWIIGASINDVDIFVPGLTAEEAEGIDEYAMGFRVTNVIEHQIKYQIIKHRFQNGIEEVLDHFDIGICKIAYPGYYLLHEHFIEDYQHKILTVHLRNWRHEPHLEKLREKFPHWEVINKIPEELF